MKITNQLFLDYVECKYRAHLRLTGSAGRTSEISDFASAQLRAYRIRACRHLRRQFATTGQVISSLPSPFPLTEDFVLATDVVVAHSDIVAHIDAILRAPQSDVGVYNPVMFAYEDKIRKHHKLLLAFGANALARQQGTEVPIGTIVHGGSFRNSKVTLEPLLKEADRVTRSIRDLARSGDAPRLLLNNHCPTCEFCDSCRHTAVLDNDLSLLQGMKEKEIITLNRRGIFTVEQLSYTYRPR